MAVSTTGLCGFVRLELRTPSTRVAAMCTGAGHSFATLLTRALPRKCLLMKLDCSQPLAIAKACSAARGVFSMMSKPVKLRLNTSRSASAPAASSWGLCV
ncbi:hypothetical protein WJX79_002937 [Trebouxia sp. C0005]